MHDTAMGDARIHTDDLPRAANGGYWSEVVCASVTFRCSSPVPFIIFALPGIG